MRAHGIAMTRLRAGQSLDLVAGGNHVIVAGAERRFPSGDGKRKDVFQFVVARLVGCVHGSGKERQASRGIGCCSGAGLHKRAGNGVHLTKAGVGQAFLCGESVRGKGDRHGREAKGISGVKKFMWLRRRLKHDEGTGCWREGDGRQRRCGNPSSGQW